jgi:hypothetical protein
VPQVVNNQGPCTKGIRSTARSSVLVAEERVEAAAHFAASLSRAAEIFDDELRTIVYTTDAVGSMTAGSGGRCATGAHSPRASRVEGAVPPCYREEKTGQASAD